MSAGKFEPLRAVRPKHHTNPLHVVLAVLLIVLLLAVLVATLHLMVGYVPTVGVGS